MKANDSVRHRQGNDATSFGDFFFKGYFCSCDKTQLHAAVHLPCLPRCQGGPVSTVSQHSFDPFRAVDVLAAK